MSLVLDLAPLILILVFVGIVGWIFLKTSKEARKRSAGTFRVYQLYLLIVVILLAWQFAKMVNHLRERRNGLHRAAQGAPP